MKKKEFISEVAKKAEVSVKDTEKVINGMNEVVHEQLNKLEKVGIPGLGVFKPTVKEGGMKQFRNPRTKEIITKKVETKIVVSFKGEKGFLECLVPPKSTKKK